MRKKIIYSNCPKYVPIEFTSARLIGKETFGPVPIGVGIGTGIGNNLAKLDTDSDSDTDPEI